MLTIKYQAAFKKDYKRIKKRGYDVRLLEQTIAILASGNPLPAAYRDHALSGAYSGCRECHIAPDWLLVYEVIKRAPFVFDPNGNAQRPFLTR